MTLNQGLLKVQLSPAAGLGTAGGMFQWAKPDEAQDEHYEALRAWAGRFKQPLPETSPEERVETAAASSSTFVSSDGAKFVVKGSLAKQWASSGPYPVPGTELAECWKYIVSCGFVYIYEYIIHEYDAFICGYTD